MTRLKLTETLWAKCFNPHFKRGPGSVIWLVNGWARSETTSVWSRAWAGSHHPTLSHRKAGIGRRLRRLPRVTGDFAFTQADTCRWRSRFRKETDFFFQQLNWRSVGHPYAASSKERGCGSEIQRRSWLWMRVWREGSEKGSYDLTNSHILGINKKGALKENS